MQGFVVNGELAPINDYPYCVFVNIICKNGAFMCGGSVLNQDIVLTAAHCLHLCQNSKSIQNITLNLGSTNKQRGFKTAVTKYIVHENYENRTHVNDIALLKTRIKVTFSSTISRVAIMQKPPITNKDAQVAGWGLIDVRIFGFSKKVKILVILFIL